MSKWQRQHLNPGLLALKEILCLKPSIPGLIAGGTHTLMTGPQAFLPPACVPLHPRSNHTPSVCVCVSLRTVAGSIWTISSPTLPS